MTKETAIIAAKTFRKDADELLQRMKAHKKELTGNIPVWSSRPKPTIEELETILAEEGSGNVTIGPTGEIYVASDKEEQPDDISEVIAQHMLSIRDLENAIMRQGMALKYIGNPNPYPNSYDASNTKVDPTADGLKL